MDYVDRHVPVLMRMFEKRARGYRAMGYSPSEHAAVPGKGDDGRVIEYDEEAIQSPGNEVL